MNRPRLWALILCALLILCLLHAACCREAGCVCCAAIRMLGLSLALWRLFRFFASDLTLSPRTAEEPRAHSIKTPVQLKMLLLD